MVHGCLVPLDGRSLSIQTRSDTWTRQDPIHPTQHGTSPLLLPHFTVFEHDTRQEEGADMQNLPGGIFEIMQGYMKYGSTFNIEGSEF